MSAHRRVAATSVLLLLAVGWYVTRSFAPEPTGAAPMSPGLLAVEGPSEIEAGAPWHLTVAGSETVATVDLWASTGARRAVLPIEEGRVSIPGDLTRQSGRLTASVSTAAAAGVATVEVVPGPAVDGIVPLAGPRSMVADGAHLTMVTAIPADRYGNTVADGTPVFLHVRRPDGSVEVIESSVEHLLAGIRVSSTTTAGRSTIRVTVDGATGPEVEVLEVPGPPVEVELRPVDSVLRADGRTLHILSTGPLADRFGNSLLDGTAASLSTAGPTGAGSASSVTIDGRAEFVIEAPPAAGVLEVAAVVDGIVSGPMRLEFEADVDEIPVAMRRLGDRVVIDVGPVLTGLGGFVPDATTVTVTGDGASATTDTRDGKARLEIDASSGARLVVEVLGVRTEVLVP